MLTKIRPAPKAQLPCASHNNHVEIVRLLVEANADRDKAASDGATPMVCASLNGNVDIVRLLVEANADKDKADTDGKTPLVWASQKGHVEMIRLLEAKAHKKARLA